MYASEPLLSCVWASFLEILDPAEQELQLPVGGTRNVLRNLVPGAVDGRECEATLRMSCSQDSSARISCVRSLCIPIGVRI